MFVLAQMLLETSSRVLRLPFRRLLLRLPLLFSCVTALPEFLPFINFQ